MLVNQFLLLFKEVCLNYINSILYYHQVYPTFVFEERRTFNQVNFFSKSPKLNDYLNSFIDDITKLLANQQLIEFKVALMVDSTVHDIYTIEFTDIVRLAAKDESHIELSDDKIYREFNKFIYSHVNYLKSVRAREDTTFKLILNTNAIDYNDSSFVDCTQMKILDEVNLGVMNFNSIHRYA